MADERVSFFFLSWQKSLVKKANTRKTKQKSQRKAHIHRYMKRKREVFFFFVTFLSYFQRLPVRDVWSRPRSDGFWFVTMNSWTDRDWIENLRMSKESFDVLCGELAPSIRKQDTNYRKAIPVRVRVAITLYRLGDTAHFRTISNLFGVGKSTVCSIVREVCQAIVDVLLLRYIRLPNTRQEIQELIDEFKERAGFPQVVGAVDGCHIPILKPNENPEDYVNRKNFHSIILQGLVDSQYLLRDICVGWPGKVHDSRVFKNSPLFTSCCDRSFLPQGLAKVISGQAVPPLIIGDSAYGLQDWLMRPFKDQGHLTREETNFNHALSVSRIVVENAFGRLKGRFRCLGKRLDLCLENCVLVTSACCILHNFCELRKEEFDPQWLNGVNLYNFHPGNVNVDRQDRNAVAIRNAIKNHLA